MFGFQPRLNTESPPKLNIKQERIYTKYSLMELKNDPNLFKKIDGVRSQLNINVKHEKLPEKLPEGDYFKVELHILLTIFKILNNVKQEACKIKVIQAGIFLLRCKNFTSDDKEKKAKIKTLEVDCATKLYQTARKVVFELTKSNTLTSPPIKIQDFDFFEEYKKKLNSTENFDKMQKLIKAGCNWRNKKNYKNAMEKFRLALILAEKNNLKTQQKKIRNEARKTIKQCTKSNPGYALRVSSFWGEKDLLEKVVEKVENIDVTGKSGNSALHFAIKSSINNSTKLEIVKFLISQGANPELKNSFGESPKSCVTNKELSELLSGKLNTMNLN